MARTRVGHEDKVEEDPERTPQTASAGGFKRRPARLYNLEPEAPSPGEAQEPAQTANSQTSTSDAERARAADALVRRYALWSAGVGLVPLPAVDLVVMTTFSVKMLRELGSLYGVEESAQRAKIYVGSVLSFAAPASFLGNLGRVIRSVPLAGLVLGPAAAWASTYALGQVFIQHFELGGTLLDFNPDAMRKVYEQKLVEARTVQEGVQS